jgi:hypothetical protein
MEIFFSTNLTSSDGVLYKIEVQSQNYVGFNAAIIGGSGAYYYFAGDWTDFLTLGQDVRVYEGAVVFGDKIVFEVDYNAAQDRTEVSFTTGSYQVAQTRIVTLDAAPSFEPEIISLQTEWDGQGDEILAAIKASSTTITYSNNAAFFDRFMDFYYQANDDELKLLIYKDNSGWELDWVGNIVIDLIEWQNISKPTPYTFRAIDGFNLLKDVPYTQGTLQTQTLAENFVSILSNLGTFDFFGATDPFFRESIEYSNSDVTSVTNVDSPLDYTFIADNLFIQDGEKDPAQFMSFYDALEAMLSLFNCRIFHAKGMYWVEQVRNFANPTSIVYREYLTDGTYTQSQYNHKLTAVSGSRSGDLAVMGGGTFGYLPGLLKATMEVDVHQSAKIEQSGTIRVTQSGLSPSTTIPIGSVYGGSGSGKNIRVEVDVLEDNALLPAGSFSLYVQLEIYVDNWFIRGGPAVNPYWLNDAAPVIRYWLKAVKSVARGNRTKVVFETPEIPFSAEGVNCKLTFAQNFNSGSGISGASYWTIDGIGIYWPLDTEDTENKDINEAVNVNTNYTKVLELEPLLITDEANTTSLNTLQVDENYVVGGGVSLIEATVWDADFDADNYLTQIRPMEAMSLQTKPVMKYMGMLLGVYYPFYSFEYYDRVFVMNGYVYDYKMDQFAGEWFEILNARAGLSIDKIKIYNPAGKIPVLGGEGTEHNSAFVSNTKTLGTSIYTAAGTLTSINIVAWAGNRLKSGDTISILHPVSYAEVAYFVLSATPSVSDTTLSVTSKAVADDIPTGGIIVYKKGEVTESNVVRADLFESKGVTGVPTDVSDMQDGQTLIVGSAIYSKTGGVIYRFVGTSYLA